MNISRRILLLSGILLLFVGLTSAAQARATPPSPENSLVYVPMPLADDWSRFERTGLPLYARLNGAKETYLLVGADPQGGQRLAQAGLSSRVLDPDTQGASYYLAYPMPGRPQPDWGVCGPPLLDDGVQILLRCSPSAVEGLAQAGVELRALSLTPKPLPPAHTESSLPHQINPDPTVQAIIDQISSTLVYSYTGDLSGEWPVDVGGLPYTIATRHTYSGQSIQKATQYAGEHLTELGLTVEYHQWNSPDYPNVIGEITGLTNPDEVFILCAHLDDMPSGSLAPGADDNASGSVAVLMAADVLSQYQWGCTLRFALWTGEEQGLLGSEAYAQRAYNRGENIVGVLNLDMIAYNTPSSSPDIDLHANSNMPETLILAQLFADVVTAYNLNLIPQIIPDGTGASDHASFWQYGYTAILGIEDFGDFNPRYHTTGDRLEYLDIPYYTDFVKASLGTFVHLNDCLIASGLGHLNGHVTAAGSGDPIVDAQVSAENGAGYIYLTQTDAIGFYTRTLPADVYTVTASAFGYLPASVPNVLVVTDTGTVQDFALDTASTFVISGTVSESGTGLPLYAEVQVLNTPLSSTWTNPSTGYYSLTVPEGSYTMRVSAAYHQPEERPIVADQNQTQNFSLNPLPCILLVDDDDNSPDVRPYYTSALDALGYDYDLFDVGGGSSNGPTLTQMEGYNIVIWFSGDQYSSGSPEAGPNSTDETNLAAYLDGGGRLFLSSQDYLYDMDLTPFGQNYLGIASFSSDDGDASTITGVTGDPIGDGLGPYPLSYSNGMSDYSDVVTPNVLASLAFEGNNPTGEDLNIDKHGGNWQTVFFGTSWVAVQNADSSNGQELLDRIITWFGGCDLCEPVTGLDLTLLTGGTVYPGDPLDFSADVIPDDATKPYTYTIDYGDGTAVGPLTSYDDPFPFTHSYTVPATYTVEFGAWNCDMSVPVTDSLQAIVSQPVCEPVTRVDFVWSPPNPQSHQAITFTGSYYPPTATTPITFQWNFDDGSGLRTGNPISHAYPTSDTYSVSLTGTNPCGGSVWMTHDLTVTDQPVCTEIAGLDLTLLTSGTVYPGDSLDFSADVIPDDSTPPYTYTIDYGDGTTVGPLTSLDDPLTFSHTYTHSGTYTVQLSAWNCSLTNPITSSARLTISQPCTPLAGITILGPTSGYPGVYTFSTQHAPSDATPPLSYRWDNGDTSATSQRSLDVGGHSLTVTATNCFAPPPTPTVTAHHTITIRSAPVCTPLAGLSLTQVTTEIVHPGTPLALSLDLIPDDASKPYTYTVSYGDGSLTLPAASAQDPLPLSHTYAASGTYTAQVSAWNCDMSAPLTDSLQVTVAPPKSTYTFYLPILFKKSPLPLPGS